MKLHYCYDETGKFIKSMPSKLSPLDKEEVYLLPKNATFTPPPVDIPTNEVPYYNKKNKTWILKQDKYYEEHKNGFLEAEERLKKQEEDRLLSIKDSNGVKLYKKIDGKVEKRSEDEIKKATKLIKINKAQGNYEYLKSKFIELTCYCLVDNSKYTQTNQEKLKNFKDEIDRCYNSIDEGTIIEKLIWPEPPEL